LVSSKYQDLFWSQEGTCRMCFEGSYPRNKAETHYLVPTSRICGAIPQLSHVSSCRGTELSIWMFAFYCTPRIQQHNLQVVINIELEWQNQHCWKTQEIQVSLYYLKALLCLGCNAMCFKVDCCLHLQGRRKDLAGGRLFQNVDIYVPSYTESHYRRP